MIADATNTAETSLDLLRDFERTGDAAVFELFMRRHAAMVYATCLKVTRDPHDAEDATQATFLTLASKSRLNGEIRQPEAWLRKVAHRLSLDLIRSKKRRINRENLRSEMTNEAEPLDSFDHADNGEMKSILNEELAKLPASYRMPLVLHYFGGLSREEMADQLKLKPSTLGVRLHRAREQLRKRLANRGVAMPTTAALGILLAEVVRSAVSGQMVSATAQQASAIAFGQAAPTAYATAFATDFAMGPSATMFASVLDVVARSKIKLVASTVILGSVIGVTNAKVQALLPESVRGWLPSFVVPKLSLPRFERVVPLPSFADAPLPGPSGETQQRFASAARVGFPALGRQPLAEPLASVRAASVSNVATPIAPRTMAQTTVEPEPVLARVDAGLGGRPTPETARALAAEASYSTRFPASGSMGQMREFGVGDAASSVAAAPTSDRSTAIASTAGESAGTASWGGVIGGGGGGSGGLIAGSPVPSVSSVAVDSGVEHLIAPVVGVSPLNRPGGTLKVRDAASADRDADVKATQRLAEAASLAEKVTRTAVFAGTSANYGGYADDAWRTDSLLDLSNVIQEEPTYSFAPPAVPGSGLSVNGARVTVSGTAAEAVDGTISVGFVEPSTPGLPVLPAGHQFIGAWSLTASDPFDAAEILVRYDDLRAARLGLSEQLLKLWVSDGVTWTLMWNDPTFGRDINENLIWVTASGGFKYFAVSAPEPTVAVVIVGAFAFVGGRRRRR